MSQRPHTRTSRYGRRFRAGRGVSAEQKRYPKQVREYYEEKLGGRMLRKKKFEFEIDFYASEIVRPSSGETCNVLYIR